jgi:hypothetical protein
MRTFCEIGIFNGLQFKKSGDRPPAVCCLFYNYRPAVGSSYWASDGKSRKSEMAIAKNGMQWVQKYNYKR